MSAVGTLLKYTSSGSAATNGGQAVMGGDSMKGVNGLGEGGVAGAKDKYRGKFFGA